MTSLLERTILNEIGKLGRVLPVTPPHGKDDGVGYESLVVYLYQKIEKNCFYKKDGGESGCQLYLAGGGGSSGGGK